MKKFLDIEGLKYIFSKLDDYPTNDLIGVIINAIDEAKQDVLTFNTEYNSGTNKVATMADVENAFKIEVVSSLPNANISENTIYLTPSANIENVYEVYAHQNNTWIKLSTTGINMANYVQSSQLAPVATNGAYGSLSGTPTKLSDFQNDSGFISSNNLSSINISSFNNDVPYASMNEIEALSELDPDRIQEVIDAVEGLEEYDDTAVRGLIAGNTANIEQLQQFHKDTFTSFVFCSFGIEPYIDPQTMQLVPGRYYQRSDCDTGIEMDNHKMDIILKSWLKYHYGIEDSEWLKNVTVYVYAMGDHGQYVNHMVTYWRQFSNPDITAYPHLQQVGSFRDDGYGSVHRFTSTELGAILSSNEDGYISADPTGTGKGYVSGWNTLTGRVSTIESTIGDVNSLLDTLNGEVI